MTSAETENEQTIGEATYLKLRADIIACRLSPGQKLKLEPLREAYGVGISTLREILNRLASEDLVIAEGQKGFVVALATASDLREIADLRLLLESHALGLSFSRGDLEWEGRVVSAHYKLAATEKLLLARDVDGALAMLASHVNRGVEHVLGTGRLAAQA
jgi:GntR family carbon starvation induced transcriptional regulator